MKKDELRSFIIESLRKMNYDVSEITDKTDLGPAGLDLESLAFAELAILIEDQYKVKFNDDDMESLAQLPVGEFVTVLAERVESAAGGASKDTADSTV
jgi:acyl carrier protein